MNQEKEVLRDIIRSRRSIFPASYTEQELADNLIEEILESAIYAPTHKQTEPWRFIVFKGDGKAALGAEIARLYKEKTAAHLFLEKKYNAIQTKANQAGCMVAIIATLHPDKLPEWEELAAVACAVQNIALTVHAHGLGGYWSSPAVISKLGDHLELKENEQCLGLFYMGYHNAPERKAIRTPIEDKIKWVR